MKIANLKKIKNVEEKVNLIIKNENTSKSSKMKDMFMLGLNIKDISIKMNVRYNFVYNVISNYVIVSGVEIEKEVKISKKDVIKELLLANKSVKEIAIELKTNMNYVYKIVKEIKENEKMQNVENK
jgi:transposase-like protein